MVIISRTKTCKISNRQHTLVKRFEDLVLLKCWSMKIWRKPKTFNLTRGILWCEINEWTIRTQFKRQINVVGCPSAYAKFLTHELAIPFQCFHLPNTDNKSLKCSQKLQLGSTPSQHNYFKCFCDRKEHVTPFSQVWKQHAHSFSSQRPSNFNVTIESNILCSLC